MKLIDKIEYCLKNFSETRNSDPMLTFKVIYEFHNSHIKQFEGRWWTTTEIQKEIREDLVKRYRARFNEIGKYLPTDKAVLEKRKLLNKHYREEFSPSNPSRG